MAKNKKKGSKKQEPHEVIYKDNSEQETPIKLERPLTPGSENALDKGNSQESNINDTKEEIARTPMVSSDHVEFLNRQIRELKLELESKNKPEEDKDESELSKIKAERDEFQAQYNNLLSRISSMKNVFSKIKESQNELESVQEQLTEYESQNLKLKQKLDSITKEKSELQQTVVTLNKEFSSIEEEREAVHKESQEYKKSVDDLQRQLETFNTSHSHELDFEKAQNSQLSTQLQELLLILDNNKQDISALQEEKEDLQSNMENLIKENSILKDSLKEMESELERAEQRLNDQLTEKNDQVNSLTAELERSKEFIRADEHMINGLKREVEIMKDAVEQKEKLEKECKDRVLQIGKLRHEAIILNEHLTKALAMLKQSSDSESVDKELMSNLLISFVAIPRADPRKFEVLELLSSFLNWDDDKKRQAGLILNPQTSGKRSKSGSRTENFVSMWTDYLEKQSE
ncbi:hypothetical protein ZYGM_002987 [Zygosaccharomyces mellis]|uniref:GRIP domain-containing protein n=1 Tax=Zygosaccharomyces mellis TaxID=42258 RepID=A0A4C2E9M0_9SACH|nr:hypothetical protein ZYGM_002987 [Zygosaccharomyces mellis]